MPSRQDNFPYAIAVWCLLAASPAGAEETTLRITRADCAGLIAAGREAKSHYIPGVDAHGRPVAPAELEDNGGIEVPQDFAVTLEVDLVEYLGTQENLQNLSADAPIGEIELRGGKAYFNGRPLAAESEANLLKRCHEALDARD